MVDIVLEWYRTQQMIYYGGRLSAIQRVSYHLLVLWRSEGVCSRPSALRHLYRWSGACNIIVSHGSRFDILALYKSDYYYYYYTSVQTTSKN